MYNQRLLNEVKGLLFDPINHDVDTLNAQIEQKRDSLKKYRDAGFNTLYKAKKEQIISPDVRKLNTMKTDNSLSEDAQRFRDLGYFVIRDPKWDGYFGKVKRSYRTTIEFSEHKTNSNMIPGKKLNNHKLYIPFTNYYLDFDWNFKALWCSPVDRFMGDVPDFVLERIVEEKEKGLFAGFDIFFVARQSKLEDMVEGIVREEPIDPILVGRWNTGKETRTDRTILMPYDLDNGSLDRYYKSKLSTQGCVLAMWGTDLEEIDLALFRN